MEPYDSVWKELNQPIPANEHSKRVSLFRRFVCIVEVEVFSYCNRICWFCPNSFIDRRSGNIFMPEMLYLKILQELGELDYSGMIAYSRYNEPLSNPIIYRRIEQARELLPNALLHTNTNGDYVSPDAISGLKKAGLNSLGIQYYLAREHAFECDEVKKAMEEKMSGWGFSGELKVNDKDMVSFTYREKDFIITYRARDYAGGQGCDRGGSLEFMTPHRREAPCFEAYNGIYIDFNGSVMPCCNFRSDNPKHQPFIVGDVNQRSLLDIFFGEKYAMIRSQVGLAGEKIEPCNSCAFFPTKTRPAFNSKASG